MAAYSIVVVTRDAPRLLLGCLAAVAGVARPAEVIVVDNGSTADLAGVLRLARVPLRLLRLDEHGSLGRAYNAGLDAASAPHVLLLHADVLLERDPAPASALLAREPAIGVVGAPLRAPEVIGATDVEAGWLVGVDRVRPRKRRVPLAVAQEELAVVDAVSSAWMLLRQTAPRFDERYWFRLEDIDCCLRHRARGQRVVVAGEALATHLEAGGTQARRAEPDFAAREIASRLLYHERWCAGAPGAEPAEPVRGAEAERDLARRVALVRGIPIPREPVPAGVTR